MSEFGVVIWGLAIKCLKEKKGGGLKKIGQKCDRSNS